jgi:hypothetical protein
MPEKIVRSLERTSEVQLAEAPKDKILRVISNEVFPSLPFRRVSIEDCSSSSSSTSSVYLISKDGIATIVVKIFGMDMYEGSDPQYRSRMTSGANVLRENGLAPGLIIEGPDWYAEIYGGTPAIMVRHHVNCTYFMEL